MMSVLYAILDGRGCAYLSILGIIAIVKVAGVGNKVECGVILETSTCIQQRARMLSITALVGLEERRRGDKRLTFPDFFSVLPHVSHVGRPWKEP